MKAVYNRKQIFSNAWSKVRSNEGMTFGEALKSSWTEFKNELIKGLRRMILQTRNASQLKRYKEELSKITPPVTVAPVAHKAVVHSELEKQAINLFYNK